MASHFDKGLTSPPLSLMIGKASFEVDKEEQMVAALPLVPTLKKVVNSCFICSEWDFNVTLQDVLLWEQRCVYTSVVFACKGLKLGKESIK